MYYLTIFVQANTISYYMVNNEQHKSVILAHQVMDIDERVNDLDLNLAAVIKQIRSAIDFDSKKIDCRLLFTKEWVRRQVFLLPNIKLLANEIDNYIQATLTKAFQLHEPLVYDYVEQPIKKQSDKQRELAVYAYEQRRIEHYVGLLTATNIRFIGLANHLLELPIEGNTVSDYPTQLMQNIAQSTMISGINFLPWRVQQKQQQRRRFYLITMIYLFVTIVIGYGLWYQAHQTWYHQSQQNSQLYAEYQDKVNQLAGLMDLHQQNQQLELTLAQQKSKQKQLMMIADYLTLIALQIPPAVWLESLEYQQKTVKLTGSGFSYADILLFSRQLNQHDLVAENSLINVSKQNDLLHFDSYLQFSLLDNQE